MNDGRYDELSWSARCQLLSEQRGRAAAAAAAAAALGASPLCHSLPYISFSTYTALPGQLVGWQVEATVVRLQPQTRMTSIRLKKHNTILQQRSQITCMAACLSAAANGKQSDERLSNKNNDGQLYS